MIKFGYYGNFTINWSTETYIADALERAGYRVIRIDMNNSDLVDCDYILFAKLLKTDIILKARKVGIPSICWVFDLYRNCQFRSNINVPHFEADIVITTDGDDGYPTIRQAVHKPEKQMISGNKIYDLIFVGSPYLYRKEMIKRTGAKLIQGIRGLELNKLLGQTKIVLGDSYPASNYWSNRIYEITGRGGFLIHPRVKGLYSYIPQFDEKKEMEMINYYLENDKEREELRQIQFKNCSTYDDRISEFITLLKKF